MKMGWFLHNSYITGLSGSMAFRNHAIAVSSVQGQLQLCETRQKDAAQTSTKTISAAKQF